MHTLLTRRDGKNVIQLGVFNEKNVCVLEADTLEELQAKAPAGMMVSVGGWAETPLASLSENDLA